MSEHDWAWMIVVYLFLGGLGAGSLALSGAAHLSGRAAFGRVARAGALLAPALVGLGCGLLIFDLGSPLKFWRLFAHVNPVSPMSVGSWLLILFSLVAAAYAVLHVPPEWLRRARELSHWRGLRHLERWNEPGDGALREERFPASPPHVQRLRDGLAVAGIPLGIGVGIYTGVLLGAIPARPFWNTPIVAQLFLFSAFSTATALLALATPFFARGFADREVERRALLRADLVFIVLELFILIPFIIHGELSVLSARESLKMILGGPYTGVFWGGVVGLGILVPLALEVFELSGLERRLPRPVRRAVALIAPVLVLVGGYLVRWVFVHAGQETEFL